MTTVTNEGLEWYRDLSLDGGETINEVKIGSGTNTESTTATSLGAVEYSATNSSTDVEIQEGANTNEYVCNITVTGGLEVDAGTDITEFGVFSSDGKLIAIDNFTSVTVSSGVTEAFSMTFTIDR
jgi:sulfate adenylyltransferase subunit 1 (EFTu-like GTPase family)